MELKIGVFLHQLQRRAKIHLDFSNKMENLMRLMIHNSHKLNLCFSYYDLLYHGP